MKNQKRQLFEKYLQGELSKNQIKLLEEFYEMESRRITGWDTLLMGRKEDVKKRVKPHIVSKKEKRLSPMVNAAAITLLLLIVSYVYYVSLRQIPSQEIAHKTTAYGQTSSIRLKDGSTIWLNAGSTISYPKDFTSGPRQVLLTGEAFFKIHPDPSRPFVVSTPTMTTTVLGTSFNVSAYRDEPTAITVSTGKVLVQKTAESSSSQQVNELILYPNDQAVLAEKDGPLVKTRVDASKFSSWRIGEYHLDQMTLGTFSGVLERKFGVRFIFHDQRLRDCQLSGRVKKQSLSELMELLAATLSIEYKLQGKKVHLYGHHC